MLSTVSPRNANTTSPLPAHPVIRRALVQTTKAGKQEQAGSKCFFCATPATVELSGHVCAAVTQQFADGSAQGNLFSRSPVPCSTFPSQVTYTHHLTKLSLGQISHSRLWSKHKPVLRSYNWPYAPISKSVHDQKQKRRKVMVILQNWSLPQSCSPTTPWLVSNQAQVRAWDTDLHTLPAHQVVSSRSFHLNLYLPMHKIKQRAVSVSRHFAVTAGSGCNNTALPKTHQTFPFLQKPVELKPELQVWALSPSRFKVDY